MNYYKRYIGDYARDTAHLSLTEHGVYAVLLDTQYATEKPLPEELAALHRICRATTTAERRAVDRVAEQFFPVASAGGRSNKRAEKELANSAAFADAQAKRAQMRWHGSGNANDDAMASTRHPPGISRNDASHSHSHVNQEEAVAPPVDNSTTAGLLSKALRAFGVQITPSNPYLLDWISKGLTDALAREAVTIARDRKPAPERIPAAYLNPIVLELVSQRSNGHPVASMKERPWYIASWKSIVAKGTELGLAQAEGEHAPIFKARVLEAAGITADQVRQAAAEFRA